MQKQISTPHGVVDSTADISYQENGSLVIKIKSVLGGHVHEHTNVTGSFEGDDDVANRTEARAVAEMQRHLDEQRQRGANVLAARAHVKKLTAQLT